MKNKIFLIIFIFICFCSISNVCADSDVSSTDAYSVSETIPVKLKAELDKEELSIGDKVTYSMIVKTKKGVEVEFPEFGENLAGFAIKDFGEKRHGFFGNLTIEKWYLLDTYVSGTYTIPPALIKYKEPGDEFWEEIQTNEVKVEVKSVLEAQGEAVDIRDIKGPILWKSSRFLIIVLSIVLILALIAAVIFILIRNKRVKEYIVPKRPAHEIAYEALDNLNKKGIVQEGKIKEYYEELSLIVRYYLENRFSIRAPEMTTEEFLVKARDERVLQYEHKQLLKEFLIHCDLVKFAKYGPSKDEIGKSYEAAKLLIDQTKEVIEYKKTANDKEDL